MVVTDPVERGLKKINQPKRSVVAGRVRDGEDGQTPRGGKAQWNRV